MRVKLLPFQWDFLKARNKMMYLRGGIGTGKTWVLAHWILNKVITNPETVGLVCANSYSQLNDSILAHLFAQCDTLRIPYRYDQVKRIVYFPMNGARVKAFSLEQYELLRGPEYGWIAIDEINSCRKVAFDVALGRLRCPKSHALELRAAGSPKGFNFVYDLFGSSESIYPEIVARSQDNTFLPDEYLTTLRTLYAQRFYDQEVLAKYVSLTDGLRYHGFDREKHLKVQSVIPNIIGCDFNVNPMTAIIGKKAHGLHINSEVWLNDSNTWELAERLISVGTRDIVPDATGKARKTSSQVSDHEILKSYGFNLLNTKSNPPIKDRYAAVNRAFRQGLITIDPDCTKTVMDLETTSLGPNAKDLGHISDALGYVVWKYWPFKVKRPEPGLIYFR